MGGRLIVAATAVLIAAGTGIEYLAIPGSRGAANAQSLQGAKPAASVVWWLDNDHIGFWGNERSRWQLSVADGQIEPLSGPTVVAKGRTLTLRSASGAIVRRVELPLRAREELDFVDRICCMRADFDQRYRTPIAWSPNGRLLALAVEGPHGYRLLLVPAAGKIVALPQPGGHANPYPSSVYPLRWSPDARELLVGVANSDLSGAGELWAVNVRTRAWFHVPHADDTSAVVWSPDSSAVAVTGGASDTLSPMAPNKLYVVPLGGAARKITQAASPIRAIDWSPDGARIAYIDFSSKPGQPLERYLRVIDADGSNSRIVATFGPDKDGLGEFGSGIFGPDGRPGGPVFSPDSNRLAVAVDDEIQVVDATQTTTGSSAHTTTALRQKATPVSVPQPQVTASSPPPVAPFDLRADQMLYLSYVVGSELQQIFLDGRGHEIDVPLAIRAHARWWADGLANGQAAIAPDGRHIAWWSRGGTAVRPGASDLLVARVDGKHLIRLVLNRCTQMPAGQSRACPSIYGKYFRWSSDGQRLVALFTGADGDQDVRIFNPDGKLLKTWPLPRIVTSLDSWSELNSLAPGGRWLLITTAEGMSGRLDLLDLKTGHLHPIAPLADAEGDHTADWSHDGRYLRGVASEQSPGGTSKGNSYMFDTQSLRRVWTCRSGSTIAPRCTTRFLTWLPTRDAYLTTTGDQYVLVDPAGNSVSQLGPQHDGLIVGWSSTNELLLTQRRPPPPGSDEATFAMVALNLQSDKERTILEIPAAPDDGRSIPYDMAAILPRPRP